MSPTIVFTTIIVNVDTGYVNNNNKWLEVIFLLNLEFRESVLKKSEHLYDFVGNVTNTTTKVVIDKSKTIWGNEDSCNYYEYIPIVSFLIGIIFVTFYCMCPRGGSRRAQGG